MTRAEDFISEALTTALWRYWAEAGLMTPLTVATRTEGLPSSEPEERAERSRIEMRKKATGKKLLLIPKYIKNSPPHRYSTITRNPASIRAAPASLSLIPRSRKRTAP